MTEQEIFAAAIKLSGPARAEFVNAACGENEPLRREVESLLRGHDDTGGLLPPEGVDILGPTKLHIGAAQPGDLLAGRYKLLEQIGVGGMGAVWMAEQKEPVKRKVAIKLVKAGMDSQQVLARFEAERQALALMDHPNIAKVFDGGMTEQGRPFFVMEFVKGVPLTDYCNDARLSLKDRLNLFIPVCQAVQHAHQKGIIHRDLKPSNILVCLYDGKPIPKVIDFGLAKAMHQSLTENTIHTAIGIMVGTPLYMSPEQAEMNNLDVDTRTDIYSLGVILYELLTGTTPLEQKQLKQAAYNEILRLIKEVEPPKPSTRLSSSANLPSIAAQRSIDPKQLRKSLAGDLDWIVMKSLDKERCRRYETANDLLRDVERFLSDEEVEASPPSSIYRFKKFARRYRGLLTAAGAVFAILLVGIVGTTWGMLEAKTQRIEAQRQEGIAREETKQKELARQAESERAEGERLAKLDAEASGKRAIANLAIAEEQRKRADRHFDLARKAVEDYLVKITENEELKQGDFHDLRNRLLGMAMPFYQELLKEPARDHQLEKEHARAFGRLGNIQLEIGQTEEALARLKESLALWERLTEQFPQELEMQHGLIATLEAIGRSLAILGRQKEAEEALRRRNAANEKAVIENQHNDELKRLLSTGYTDLAKLLIDTGRLQGAKEALLQSLKTDREIASPLADNVDLNLGIATTLHSLGMVHWQTGRRDEADQANSESLSILRKLADLHPKQPEVRVRLAGALDHIGAHYAQTGRLGDAESNFRESLTHYQQLVNDLPRVPQYRQEMAGCMGNLARLLLELKRDKEADAALREALQIYEVLVEEHPGRTDFRQELAFFMNQRAMQLLLEKKHDEAESISERAIRIQEAIVRRSPDLLDNYAHLGQSLLGLGMIRENAGKTVEARDTYRRALLLLTSALQKKPDHPFFLRLQRQGRENAATCCNNLAWTLATHPDETRRNGKEAVANAKEACELTEWKNWQYLDSLAAASAEAGDFENAIKWQEASIKALPLLSLLSGPELQSRLKLYKSGTPFRDTNLGSVENNQPKN